MSMCRVFSCVAGRGSLLWPACSIGKTLLGFDLLHCVLQGQICLFLLVFLDFLLFHSSPLWWKWCPFWVVVLEGLVGLHRTVQLQLLHCYWLGHRLGLLWYWMVCLGNEQRSFCHFCQIHPKLKCVDKEVWETQPFTFSSWRFMVYISILKAIISTLEKIHILISSNPAISIQSI